MYSRTVSNCYNIGDVTGYLTVGGVAGGYNDNSTVSDCYDVGSVTGTAHVGGIIGYNYSPSGSVSRCYSTGCVTGSSGVGGVAGDNTGTVTDCYYDKQLCPTGGINGSDGSDAFGLLTSALTSDTAFASWSGDTGIWNFTSGLYPRLTGYVDADTDYQMDVTNAAYVSASPVNLAGTDTEYETLEAVSTDFSVSIANGLSWDSSNVCLNIGGDGSVTISGNGTDVILTATCGDFSKAVTISNILASYAASVSPTGKTFAAVTAAMASRRHRSY